MGLRIMILGVAAQSMGEVCGSARLRGIRSMIVIHPAAESIRTEMIQVQGIAAHLSFFSFICLLPSDCNVGSSHLKSAEY